ncbi:MAG: prepilin-type N-terminal cleavage/methylation domain-containing protein, partial [Pseudomonadota bacterium]
MNVRHHSKQSGYTLIELLIALTIGAFLIGGILQLYVGSKKSYSTQQALTELQEVGRFSLNMMVRDIRLAGYAGCGTSGSVVNTLNGGSTSWQYDLATAVTGFEGGASTFPSEFSGNVVAGTDALVIVRGIPDDSYVVAS